MAFLVTVRWTSFVAYLSIAALFGVFFLVACEMEEYNPDETPEERTARLGQRVYGMYCSTCHQSGGQGVPGSYPPLRGTEWVTGDEGRLIRLVLHGVQGPMEVQGETYDNPMIAHGFLSDDQIAAVLTFVRQNFGNDAGPITPDQVAAVRAEEDRREMWEASDLWEQTGIPEE